MNRHRIAVLTWIISLVAIIAAAIAIALAIEFRISIGAEITHQFEEEKMAIEKYIRSHTPIKGIDYFDGKNGMNGMNVKGDKGDPGLGANGKDAAPLTIKENYTNEDGDTVLVFSDGTVMVVSSGVDGKDGLTPEIRCNTSKNQWEVKLPIETKWSVMNGEVVPCLGRSDAGML